MDPNIDPVSYIKSNVILSEYVMRSGGKLKADGNRRGKWRCPCIIHGGDEPTGMSIDDNLGLWKCFTKDCGGGSIFDLWMKLREKDNRTATFSEAIEGLAKEIGFVLPERKKTVSKTRIYDALFSVAEGAMEELLEGDSEDCVAVRRYLKSRSFRPSLVKKYMIGFMPSGDEALEFLEDVCKDIPALIEAGIITKTDSGTKWVGMHGRLLFPIFDQNEEVVGFGARVVPGVYCSSPDSKYKNSPNSVVYNKSEVLYGMDSITKKTNHVIVSEGYFDVIGTMESISDPNTVAVAACGTSFTSGHIELINHAKQVTMLFDGDKAGYEAVNKSLWVANKMGDKVSAVALESGQDPWDMYLDDKDNLKRLLGTGIPLVSMAVQCQYRVLNDETLLINWVKSTAPTLSYTSHRDQLIADSARLIGQNPGAFKRSLALPTDIASKRRINDDAIDSLSPQIKAICTYILSLTQAERDGVLAPLIPWSERTKNTVVHWLPTSGESDVNTLKKMAMGIDGPHDEYIDRIIADMMDSEETVDISVILQGMAKQLLSTLPSLENSYLSSQIKNIRRSLAAAKNSDYHTAVLAYLINMSIDVELSAGVADESNKVMSVVS